MPTIVERGGRFQLRIKSRHLPRPVFLTFDTRAEAEAYGAQAKALLDAGIVPAGLVVERQRPAADDLPVPQVCREYRMHAPITASDDELLNTVLAAVGGLRVSGLTAAWADNWVRTMKVRDNLAPGTIRKRVGLLARVLDWHLRRANSTAANPLRSMPSGYSLYTDADAGALAARGRRPKVDVHRDRRLTPAEEQRIRAALAGEKRADRERPWPADPAFCLLFDLILSTGLRLSEAFALRVDQWDAAGGFLRVAGSKGHRGAVKPRVVPAVPALAAQLTAWCRGRVGLMFPFWDGSPDDKSRASGRLSARFRTLFAYAGVPDMTEHDLRHEACCRWFEMRRADGAWVFSDLEVARIMGWTDLRMALRYASLRGEDLAARLSAASAGPAARDGGTAAG
jgi:integrase